MLATMTIRQFHEWRSYADLEPFDEVRADLRSAHIVQTLLNLELVRNRKRARMKLADCILRFGEAAEEPKSPEAARREIARTMQGLMALYGKKPAKKPGKNPGKKPGKKPRKTRG